MAKQRLATAIGRRRRTSTAKYSDRVAALQSRRDSLMNEIITIRSYERNALPPHRQGGHTADPLLGQGGLAIARTDPALRPLATSDRKDPIRGRERRECARARG